MNSLLFFILAFGVLYTTCASPETEINLLFEGMIPPAHGGGPCGGGSGGSYPSGPNDKDGDCSFVNYQQLRDYLSLVVCGSTWPCAASFPGAAGANGGLNTNMWASVVNRAGRVCAVAYSGPTNTDEWPGSRVISIQKASTANSFCLPTFALSTANLYQPTQPGGTLFGLQESNPVDPRVAYDGLSSNYGNPCGQANQDPSCYRKLGGVNVFGGGLGIYIGSNSVLGGLGVSGDTSCADHNIAWKLRDLLGWDNVPAGEGYYDNIIYPADDSDTLPPFGHPVCSAASESVAENFPTTYPVGANTSRRSLRSVSKT